MSDMVTKIHSTAIEKGWWPHEGRNVGEILALIHSEVSEALEEYRTGKSLTEVTVSEKGKPEGFPVELADVIIRVLDLCGHLGIDIASVIQQKMEFNQTRPVRHGGKKA